MNSLQRTDGSPTLGRGTFATFATPLFEAGFSPLPIIRKTKQTPITGWSGYCDNLPRVETLQEWIRKYPDLGVGVCLGREMKPGLRFAAIDIDLEVLRFPIRGLFGNAKCIKRGKKGETIFALAAKSIKSTYLRTASGKQAVDILIGGKQTVLPPTIHPDTGLPYSWIGPTLLDITPDDLPVLDLRAFEVLQTLVASEHTEFLMGEFDGNA